LALYDALRATRTDEGVEVIGDALIQAIWTRFAHGFGHARERG
jgi:hypothetical protein